MSEGRKDDAAKQRYDLVPYRSLDAIVDVLTFGAKKYGDNNWRLVENQRARYFAAAMRHLTQWFIGEECDKESDLQHLAHAGCCIMFLLDPPQAHSTPTLDERIAASHRTTYTLREAVNDSLEQTRKLEQEKINHLRAPESK